MKFDMYGFSMKLPEFCMLLGDPGLRSASQTTKEFVQAKMKAAAQRKDEFEAEMAKSIREKPNYEIPKTFIFDSDEDCDCTARGLTVEKDSLSLDGDSVDEAEMNSKAEA